MTFKDDSGDYSAPTEIIPINNCCTVKSADDELNIKNSFVSFTFFRFFNTFYHNCRKSWFRIELFTSWEKIIATKKDG